MNETQVTLQTNFSAGELSPSLQGFVNLKQYISGLLKQENFINDNNGGVFFRPGTYYAANTAGNLQAKPVPFVFNKVQAYTLEFTNNRLRFYTNNGQLQVSYSTTAGSWASGTATLTIGAHVFLSGDTVTVSGVSPSGFNGTFTLTGVTATTISYAVANPGTYSSAGTAQGAYQLVTPYTIGPNSWAQIDDVMYLADGANPIQVLTRLGAVNWTLAAISPVCGPFTTQAQTATMSVSGSTVTASTATFASTDVGRHIMILDTAASYNGSAGAWKWASISGYTNSTTVTVGTWQTTTAAQTSNTTFGSSISITGASWAANVATFNCNTTGLVAGMSVVVAGMSPSGYNGTYTIATTTAGSFTVPLASNPGAFVSGGTIANTTTNQWFLGAWSATTGYPTNVIFHQQRLVAGGATNSGNLSATTFYGSVIGLFNTFAPFDPDGTVNPDNAFSFQIASGRADGIKWMLSDRYLLIGTGAGEYIARSSGPAITPTDVDVQNQTSLGNSGVTPAQLNYRLVLPQRGSQLLYQWSYNWQVGGYMARMINKEADHILKPSITRMDFQLNPAQRVFMVRSDGQVVVATDNGENWAYGRLILGGAFGSGNAVVEDLCVIPTSTYDQVWLSVKRTVNSQTVRFMEYLNVPFDGVMSDCYQVDAGLQYNGSPTTTLTGFSYLQGQTVAVMGDGVYQGDQVVPANGILAVTSASKFSVGLKYTGTGETLQLSGQEIQGKLQYAVRAYLRLYQTWGGNVLSGPNYATVRPISESAASLYTGSSRIVLDHGSDTEQHIVFQQVSPFPMTVLNASIDFQSGAS